ncbi:Ig-like domain-containing protein [Ureibacillus sinduriensis]|uniref:Ig-like domain-containing protein n=1 Tax=Ureibacillus sinduriensis TaxID=561440 RepID=UPI0035A2A639
MPLGRGTTSEFQYSFVDQDGDTLIYTVSSDNPGVLTASMNPSGGAITLALHSKGTAVITITADDGKGGTKDMTATYRII